VVYLKVVRILPMLDTVQCLRCVCVCEYVSVCVCVCTYFRSWLYFHLHVTACQHTDICFFFFFYGIGNNQICNMSYNNHHFWTTLEVQYSKGTRFNPNHCH
jgi:hypothetical protein